MFICDATELLQRILRSSTMRIVDNPSEVAELIFDTPFLPSRGDTWGGIYQGACTETVDHYDTRTVTIDLPIHVKQNL
jgi:hypothetical protein